MTVEKLIEALRSVPPGAHVFFGPEEGANVLIEGGICRRDKATGLDVLVLAPLPLDGVGGF